MAEARDAVRNAADPEQVRRAGRTEKDARRRYLDAVRATLATESGRAFCWELLCKARIYESIFSASAAIYYNAGRQDYGHELQADLVAADEERYVQMETEARARARRERTTNEAAQIAPAEEQTHG